MRRSLTVFAILVTMAFISQGFAQGTEASRVATAYSFPPADTFFTGLQSIRGVNVAVDPFGDGVNLISATNYFTGGAVHVFAAVGMDSIELKWSSPPGVGGGGSTPRHSAFGDLDNDGVVEIIFQNSDRGFYIYEWDGVPGSYNFGDAPAQIIDDTYFPATSGYTEWFDISDVDGDGANELITAYNAGGSVSDGLFVISANGEWETGDPGFSGFNVELEALRSDPFYGALGFGGSPMGAWAAQLDGTGNEEVFYTNWNFKNVTVVRATAADTYEAADTTGGNGNLFITWPDDNTALFGGFATDIDGDGREEAYLSQFGSANAGKLHMIYFDEGSDLSKIDSSNLATIDVTDVLNGSIFGHGVGDIDQDGRPNIYMGFVYGSNVATAEFQGGDKTDPANWTTDVLYEGEDDIYTSVTYSDSLGTVDTSYAIDNSFVAKLGAGYFDLDNDGFEDIILPYQALNDSLDVTEQTWDADSGAYVVDAQYKVVNPKRWSLRVLEGTIGSSIEAKDLTVITPNDYKLKQNYPNPFNPETTIEFVMPVRKKITMTIYNTRGQKVKTLLKDASYPQGTHSVKWDGTNEAGQQVATGMYIYEFKFGNFTKSKRMMLVK